MTNEKVNDKIISIHGLWSNIFESTNRYDVGLRVSQHITESDGLSFINDMDHSIVTHITNNNER